MQSHLLRFTSRMSYYAVANGRNIGIYSTWNECERQVKGFSSAKFKKFKTEGEANSFISAFQNCRPKPHVLKQLHTPPGPPATYRAPHILPSSTSRLHYKKPYEVNKTSTKLIQQPVIKASSGPTDKDYVDVYTDGASSNNGKRGAAAGIGVYWGSNSQWNVSDRLQGRQTNNRAEIHAVCRAVDQASVRGITKLRVYTDSKFLIDAYTKWLPRWKRNGWKLSTGGPVKNQADFEELEELVSGLVDVQFVHVAGHSGDAGNTAADKLAVQGAHRPYLFIVHKHDFEDSFEDDFDDF